MTGIIARELRQPTKKLRWLWFVCVYLVAVPNVVGIVAWAFAECSGWLSGIYILMVLFSLGCLLGLPFKRSWTAERREDFPAGMEMGIATHAIAAAFFVVDATGWKDPFVGLEPRYSVLCAVHMVLSMLVFWVVRLRYKRQVTTSPSDADSGLFKALFRKRDDDDYGDGDDGGDGGD